VSIQGPLPSFPNSEDETPRSRVDGAEASWGRRAVAYLLDGVLVGVLAIVLTSVTGHHEPWSIFKFHTVNGQQRLVPVGTKLLFFSAANALLAFLYAAGFLSSSWQATPFMRALGIHIATADQLGHVGIGRASARAAIFEGASVALSRVPFGSLLILVDLLWPLWDSRNQTIHDKLAGTVVLRGATPR